MLKRIRRRIDRKWQRFRMRTFRGVLEQYHPDLHARNEFGILTRLTEENFPRFLTTGVCSDAEPIIKTLDSRLRPLDTSIDIGANRGIVTTWLARRSRRVIAFEPEPANLESLRETLATNQVENVTVCDRAVSDRAGSADFYLLEGSGHHSLGPVTTSPRKGTCRIRTTTLDEYCAQAEISRIDFLKIDVEGFELEVFRGMRRLLESQAIGMIVFEISKIPLRDLGRDGTETLGAIRDHGFEIRNLDGSPVGDGQVVQIHHADLMAIPSDSSAPEHCPLLPSP